jgi:hypothetical protein
VLRAEAQSICFPARSFRDKLLDGNELTALFDHRYGMDGGA